MVMIYPVDSAIQRLNYRGLVYTQVPANLMLGVNPPMDWHPVQGGIEILRVASLSTSETTIISGRMSPTWLAISRRLYL